MNIEYSNFAFGQSRRSIPDTCPKELRAKVEHAREQRAPVTPQPVDDKWELMKKFASISEA